jgi:hypothetical protein
MTGSFLTVQRYRSARWIQTHFNSSSSLENKTAHHKRGGDPLGAVSSSEGALSEFSGGEEENHDKRRPRFKMSTCGIRVKKHYRYANPLDDSPVLRYTPCIMHTHALPLAPFQLHVQPIIPYYLSAS